MSKKDGINIYLKQHIKYMVTFLGVIVMMAFFAPLKSFILQWLIDAQNMREAIIYLGLGCVIILCNFAFNLIGNNMFSQIQTSSVSNIRNMLMQQLLYREKEEQNEESNAEYLSILTNDMQIIATDYYEAGYNIISFGIILLVSLIMYIYIDISMLFFVAIAGVASVTLPRILDKILEKTRKIYSEEVGKYTLISKELLDGYDVIRNFLVTNNYQKLYNDQSKKVKCVDYRFHKLINCSSGLSSLVSNMLFFIVLLFGMLLVFQNKITLGYMVAATYLSNFVIAPCQIISANYAKFKSSKRIVGKINQLLEVNNFESSYEAVIDDIITINMNNVSFCYKSNSNIVLKDINLKWDENNKKIAIIGESGSGKSTIAKLIYKFSEQYQGDIYINGIELRKIQEQKLYNKVGYVPQDVFIFNDTLKHNITLYDIYTDSEIKEALEKAGLVEFVNSLPKGIDTELLENGKNLSGGQIKRISLARVLLRKYKCIIVDEMTANLDPSTTHLIMNNLLGIDIMLLVITHDVNNEFMNKFDTIYDLKLGKLEKEGDIKKKNGSVYA